MAPSHHAIVYYDQGNWAAVPANNGMNGPAWQWGRELLVGFTRGVFHPASKGHQCSYEYPFESWLARSSDGGRSWDAWRPQAYAGIPNVAESASPPGNIDFTKVGFVLRVEGAGYHGNDSPRWFYSDDRGASWNGPFSFDGLLSDANLSGTEFTARTAYIVEAPNELSLFLTVRERSLQDKLNIALREKTFLARTVDSGRSFSFCSWVVPWDDPWRAAMPAPVRISNTEIIAAVRRKSSERNWIDCFASGDNGLTWSLRAKVGETESGNDFNGNPPSLIRMEDGRICAAYGNRSDQEIVARYSSDNGTTWGDTQVIRDDFQSKNGWPDLGYVRLFQRPDRRLVVVYFWCTSDYPETHVESTIFDAPML